MGEWVSHIVKKAEIPDHFEESPYFVNVKQNNQYFNDIQAAVEWSVLNNSVNFDPSKPLTKEWAAYTLVNLYGDTSSDQKVKDSSKSQFPDHISASVSLGLFTLDDRDCFNPKDKLTEEEALEKLDIMIDYINNWSTEESSSSFEFNSDIIDLTGYNVFFNKANLVAEIEGIDLGILVDSIVTSDQFENMAYKVTSIKENDGFTEINLTVPEYDEIFKEVNVDSTFEVDFTEAEIDFGDFDIEVGENGDFEDGISFKNPFLQTLASKKFTHEDYSVSVDITKTSLSAKISKKLKAGGNLAAQFKVFDFNPSVRWDTKGFSIDDAYLKLNYSATSSLSYSKGRHKHIYSEVSKNIGNQILNGIRGINSDNLEATITLGKISVPIPNVPFMNLSARIQLYLYANGKIELSFKSDNEMGIEIKKNKMRFFHDNEKRNDFMIRATGGIIGGINTGIDIFNKPLVNISLQSGIRTKIQSSILLKNERKIEKSNLEYDQLENNSDKFKVCGEISAFWSTDVVVNSEDTLASKVGLSYKKSIFNDKNASLIPADKRYIENGQFVKKCFIDNYIADDNFKLDDIESENITLSEYNLVMNINDEKQISITGLPKGYNYDDIEYSINNKDIKVDDNFKISSSKATVGILTVSTKDNKYKVQCNIVIVDKNNE
ncbi:MAG: hypothetical protein ACK5KQ_04860 [Anaerorhabdus sp.]